MPQLAHSGEPAVTRLRQNGRVPASRADNTAYTFTAALWEWDAKVSWFFVTVPVEISDEIARCAAQLCGQRSSLSLDNAVILASAQVAGRILITRNTKDFPAAMPGIRVPYTL